MTLYDKIAKLSRYSGVSAWAERICGELNFAQRMSTVCGGKYDGVIADSADYLLDSVTENGTVTNAAAMEAEKMLLPLHDAAKTYDVGCIGHAHIDMNWMWGYQETVGVTLDTFRTMLKMMDEFPEFTFGQSQASVYRIVEEYEPEMLEEIKRRIKEGRWEVTASTWVEADKNMPSGESFCRHLLYTRKYLSELLDIPAEDLDIDYEPDTFGHSANIPEILSKGGVKYYYHCRGNTGTAIYNWEAPSGERVLTYCEPSWYNYDIGPQMFEFIPELCAKYGVKDCLRVYGVGDHGGGPTRRDIRKLYDMASWPIMPKVHFGTYREFFRKLEEQRDSFPTVKGEMNFVFTGCYTSQSRIKEANSISEARLYDAEVLCSASGLLGGADRNDAFKKAWERTLFNHFHDIIPGSGIRETREYAMGSFQTAMAYANSSASAAMRKIAECIDTSSVSAPLSEYGRSEGAGAGLFVSEAGNYSFAQPERGNSDTRIYHIFNTTQYDFEGLYDINVWDWDLDPALARFTDPDGVEVPSMLFGHNSWNWGHDQKIFTVKVRIPALGYSTYVLEKRERTSPAPINIFRDPRIDDFNDLDIVLENEYVKATFRRESMELVSFVDKESGKELVNSPSAYFSFVTENAKTVAGMSSWRIGPAEKTVNVNRVSKVHIEYEAGGMRKRVRYGMPFGKDSHISAEIVLDDGARGLRFNTEINFFERGSHNDGIPRIDFCVPVACVPEKYRYDIPFGHLDRTDRGFDMPALSYIYGGGVQLVTDNKYGYRGSQGILSVDLIRGSFEPDPCPEYGMHKTVIGIFAAKEDELARNSVLFRHKPSHISALPSEGSLPMSGKLFDIAGNVRVSAVKPSEDGQGVTVRLYNEGASAEAFAAEAFADVKKAYVCDIEENVLREIPADGGSIAECVPAYSCMTLKLVF